MLEKKFWIVYWVADFEIIKIRIPNFIYRNLISFTPWYRILFLSLELITYASNLNSVMKLRIKVKIILIQNQNQKLKLT